MTRENAEFSNEFNEIRLKIEIEPKIREKTTFETENFTIYQEKIRSIRSKMTRKNAQFQGEFN